MGLNVVGQQTLTAVRNKVNLSVYFKVSTTEQRVSEVRQTLLQRPEVASIRLITRDEHLQNLIHSQTNSTLVHEAVKQLGENPLGPGLVITAKSLDQYGAISKALKDPQYASIIESTGNDYETNQQIIGRLSLIVHRIESATLWLTMLLGLIAALMVFNTIRVTIYSQREEIGIMKLVGASDAFVRGPFIVTSLMYGILGSVIVTLILLPILTLSNPFFSQFFAGYDINVLGYFKDHVWIILGYEVLTASVLSVLSSVFALGRYLRV